MICGFDDNLMVSLKGKLRDYETNNMANKRIICMKIIVLTQWHALELLCSRIEAA